jgi:hypothetical protein
MANMLHLFFANNSLDAAAAEFYRNHGVIEVASIFLIFLALYLAVGLVSALVLVAACILSARFEAHQLRPARAPNLEYYHDGLDTSVDRYLFPLGNLGRAEVYALLDESY